MKHITPISTISEPLSKKSSVFLDKSDRRRRHIPVPTGRGFRPMPRDLLIFQALATFGDLSVKYLHPLLEADFPSYQMLQRRLSILFHEARLLDRPPQQWRTFNARGNEAVYSLNKDSKKLCAEHGIDILKQDGHWEHEHMTACVTASLAIFAGYKVLPIQSFTTNVDGKDIVITPDAMGMLGDRLIITEVDKGTEPHISENKKRKSTARMFTAWRQLIGGGEVQKICKKVLLLYVTTSPTRKHNAMGVLKSVSGGKVNYILFNDIDLFEIIADLHYYTPKPPFKHLAGEWMRVGNEPLSLT